MGGWHINIWRSRRVLGVGSRADRPRPITPFWGNYFVRSRYGCVRFSVLSVPITTFSIALLVLGLLCFTCNTVALLPHPDPLWHLCNRPVLQCCKYVTPVTICTYAKISISLYPSLFNGLAHHATILQNRHCLRNKITFRLVWSLLGMHLASVHNPCQFWECCIFATPITLAWSLHHASAMPVLWHHLAWSLHCRFLYTSFRDYETLHHVTDCPLRRLPPVSH